MDAAGATLVVLAEAGSWSGKTEVGLIVAFVGFLMMFVGRDAVWLSGPGLLLIIVGIAIIA